MNALDSIIAEANSVWESFASFDRAVEEEIAAAQRRYPTQADLLWHCYRLCQPPSWIYGKAEFVYRGHIRELLTRVATGKDTRPGTAAEVCIGCRDISLVAPMHGAGAGLYFRMWLQAFPNNPISAGMAEEQAHYERLHGHRMDELERLLRNKTSQPTRTLNDPICCGLHRGEKTDCRFVPQARQENR